MTSDKPGPAAAGDKDLVAALKRREPWAWDRLQSRCLDPVFAYLLLHCPRREDAEDLTAEVFVAAIASIERYRGDARIETWLIGIARRKVIDAARRRTRRPEVLASDLSDGARLDGAGSTLPPDETLAQRERLASVRQAVLQLPEPQRDALWLRCVHQLSLAETAQVLQRSENAIKGLLRRAKLAVQERLGEQTATAPCEEHHVENAIPVAAHLPLGK